MLEKLPEVVGHVLRDRRAGLDKLVFNRSGLRTGLGLLQVTSLAFVDHAAIPERYTADGEGLSPPLAWTGVPAGTGSVALIVEDADAPTGEPLVHAIVVDLPAGDGSLHEGALKSPGHEGDEVHEGRNSYLRAGWLPPDPPPGHGEHRYAFQVFALAPGEAFQGTPGRDALLEAIRQRGLASGLLVGTYARPDGTIRNDAPQAVRVGVPPV
jgi:Raf kinase inhibitor-like YbhB/YbcL family protein